VRYYELLFEAAYDSMITSMLSKYPDFIDAINWAKQSNSLAKRQDRVVWYLRQVRGIIEAEDIQNKLDVIEKLQQTLDHYLLQEIPKINSYIFSNDKNIDVTFNELKALENEFRKRQQKNRPVPIKKGDYKLIEYPDGSNWWFVNRAYCKDEGRSGHHCGNVDGQTNKSQRILSYRDRYNSVLLTFILHKNGKLGEMKAKYNRKPESKYHKVIIDLLLNDIVKGIQGGGYLPTQNFSLSDLQPNEIDKLYKLKPKIVLDFIKNNPISILKVPEELADILSKNRRIDTLSKEFLTLRKNPSTKNWTNLLVRLDKNRGLDGLDFDDLYRLWHMSPVEAKKRTLQILVDNIIYANYEMEDTDNTGYSEYDWPTEFRVPKIAKNVFIKQFDNDNSGSRSRSRDMWPYVFYIIQLALPNINNDQKEQNEFFKYLRFFNSENFSLLEVKQEFKNLFEKNPNLKKSNFIVNFIMETSGIFSTAELEEITGISDINKIIKNISVEQYLDLLKRMKGIHFGSKIDDIFKTENFAKAVSLLSPKELRATGLLNADDGFEHLVYICLNSDTETAKKILQLVKNSIKLYDWDSFTSNILIDISEKELKDENFCKMLMNFDSNLYKYIPHKNRTKEMTLSHIDAASRQRLNYVEIGLIPDELFKDKDVIKALKKVGFKDDELDDYIW